MYCLGLSRPRQCNMVSYGLMGRGLSLRIPEFSPAPVAGIFRGGNLRPRPRSPEDTIMQNAELTGVLYCIVLMGSSFLPNALRPFQIYFAPLNLGITRTWICRWNFAQRPIFYGLKSQTRDLQLKVSLGGLMLRIFTSWKDPTISAGFEPANLGSRGEHVTPRPPRPTTGATPMVP